MDSPAKIMALILSGTIACGSVSFATNNRIVELQKQEEETYASAFVNSFNNPDTEAQTSPETTTEEEFEDQVLDVEEPVEFNVFDPVGAISRWNQSVEKANEATKETVSKKLKEAKEKKEDKKPEKKDDKKEEKKDNEEIVDPTPIDPTPVDPTPVEPEPEEPTPVDPTPVDPTPVEPEPEEPTPAVEIPEGATVYDASIEYDWDVYYIANTKTKIYHDIDCPNALNADGGTLVVGTKDEFDAAGYIASSCTHQYYYSFY